MSFVNQIARATLVAVVLIGFSPLATAQVERNHGPGPGGHGMVFDSRFHHDHYYPPHGYSVGRLPYGYRSVAYGRDRYFFYGGVWYRPWGGGFQVFAPPIGLVVPFLPDFYTTIWFGGIPYYYADDTYYVYRRDANGYVVAEPPPNAQSSAQVSAPSDDFYMYPRNGQSADQQAKDRFECHQWAVGQTGFDPSEPGGGVAEAQNDSKRTDYRRAISACLEGRQYSIK